MKELVSVIIPIPDPELTPTQERSLHRCLETLERYPVMFIASEGADLSIVKEHKADADIIYFPREYFESRRAMAKLFLLDEFYERFSWTDFLLIHELNSWIVKDELHYWCKQGYDYLKAAPAISDAKNIPSSLSLILGLNQNQKMDLGKAFENNGLILCNVQRMIKTLRRKAKTAYQYRHDEILSNRDAVFWEAEANRLWPSIRKPTPIVRDFFCMALSDMRAAGRYTGKTQPFAFTGVNKDNVNELPAKEI
jgi:hypothetical protein